MYSLFRIATLISVLLFVAGVTLEPSQAFDPDSPDSAACAEIVNAALARLAQACEETGRNEACYGHIELDAQPQPDIVNFDFDQEGDIESVVNIRTLRLAALNTDLDVWGVAMLRLQAGLPSNQPGNVTVLLFGDVELENATTAPVELDLEVTSNVNANVRARPNSNSPVVGSIAPGTMVVANGRLADDSWVRIMVPELGIPGWVASFLLEASPEVETLNVVKGSDTYYGPMQAVYFNSGIDDSVCPEQPGSGLLIQTPEGDAEITYLINEVNIQLTSTAYFQAEPGESMTVNVIDGEATVTAGGVSQTLGAGTQLTVPMDENMSPTGTPSVPRSYDMDEVGSLPTASLGREVEVSPPATIATDTDDTDDTDDTTETDTDPTVATDTDNTTSSSEPAPPEETEKPEHPLGGPPGQTGDDPPGKDKGK